MKTVSYAAFSEQLCSRALASVITGFVHSPMGYTGLALVLSVAETATGAAGGAWASSNGAWTSPVWRTTRTLEG